MTTNPDTPRRIEARTLLRVGAVAAVVFVGVLLVEGALRPGYDPSYHTGSALSLGDRGWIQIANFIVMGLAMLAFAAGVLRTLQDPVAAALLAVFALAMVAAGVFVMDPMRGYPPGTPLGTPAELTWQQHVHDVVGGPVAFFALAAACLVVSRRLRGPWRVYTVLTGIIGLAFIVWTAVAWQTDAANTGLVQRGLILVYWSWIALLGTHLSDHPRAGENAPPPSGPPALSELLSAPSGNTGRVGLHGTARP